MKNEKDALHEAAEKFRKGKKKKKTMDALDEGKHAFMMKQMMGKKMKGKM